MDLTSLVHPVLLCGGSGTRLWPLSRASYPKQFAQLTGEQSLFQATAARLSGPEFAAPLVVSAHDFRFIVTEQLAAQQQAATLLIEPEPRNTAPACLAAALWLPPEAVMLIAPSDHLIPDAQAFVHCVQAALPRARGGEIVTFGIAPTRVETGYGYLELGTGADPQASTPQPLARFVEKPDPVKARAMIAGGRHLWNAGLFLCRADALITAYEITAPKMLAQVRHAVKEAQPDLNFHRLGAEDWAEIEPISIDYAVMEKTRDLVVMPYHGTWSDLGDWAALGKVQQADAQGNITTGTALAMECEGSLLRSEDPQTALVGLGLRDMIAVATPDAVLVAHRSRAQQVGAAVKALAAQGVPQATRAVRDYRPWGWFETLSTGPRFQVKRIVVNPGGALSLQSHHHRAEHWVVVSGTARITIEEVTSLVTENQSVYIPLGARHRLENPGKLPMILIEIQTGSYLGEDDIVRYEDIYARV